MYSFVAIGDYNNDGKQDILLAGYSDSFYLTKLYRNTGDSFVDSEIAFDSVAYGDGVFTDYDKDGDLDLFLIGNNNQMQYIIRQYRNDGNEVFTSIQNDMQGEWGGEITATDFNNDGYPDLAVTGSLCCGDALTRLYTNNGAGSFIALPITFPPMANSNISFGDFDNDGDSDFILTGYPVGDTISAATYLYRNMITNSSWFTNNPPDAPDNLTSTVDGQKVSFYWNHAQDDLTPSIALSYNLRVGLSPFSMEFSAPWSNPTTGFIKVYDFGNVQQDTTWILSDLPPGTYHWSVQALDHSYAGSVFAPAGTFTIASTGTQEFFTGDDQILISPNPVSNILRITIGNSWQNAGFSFFDIKGIMIATGTLDKHETLLETHNLAPGMYFLIIRKDNIIRKIKIIKE
jgi:hypothetical protein